jgi:hypothetical protein
MAKMSEAEIGASTCIGSLNISTINQANIEKKSSITFEVQAQNCPLSKLFLNV